MSASPPERHHHHRRRAPTLDDEPTVGEMKRSLNDMKLSMSDERRRLERTRERWRRQGGVARSRVVLAALVFLGVAAVLLLVNPPLTQGGRRTRFDLERQDPRKVVAVAALATLPVLLAPRMPRRKDEESVAPNDS